MSFILEEPFFSQMKINYFFFKFGLQLELDKIETFLFDVSSKFCYICANSRLGLYYCKFEVTTIDSLKFKAKVEENH